MCTAEKKAGEQRGRLDDHAGTPVQLVTRFLGKMGKLGGGVKGMWEGRRGVEGVGGQAGRWACAPSAIMRARGVPVMLWALRLHACEP